MGNREASAAAGQRPTEDVICDGGRQQPAPSSMPWRRADGRGWPGHWAPSASWWSFCSGSRRWATGRVGCPAGATRSSEQVTDRSQPALLKSIQDLSRFTAASGEFQVVNRCRARSALHP
jgi:hypothetical protein